MSDEDAGLIAAMQRCHESLLASQAERDDGFDVLTEEDFWRLCDE